MMVSLRRLLSSLPPVSKAEAEDEAGEDEVGAGFGDNVEVDIALAEHHLVSL